MGVVHCAQRQEDGRQVERISIPVVSRLSNLRRNAQGVRVDCQSERQGEMQLEYFYSITIIFPSPE